MKSLIMYKITNEITITSEDLTEFSYEPCGAYTKSSLGFCDTFDNELVTESNGKTIIQLAYSDKKPNTAEVDRRTEALCRAYEREFEKKPNKKTQDDYKESVIMQLLPETFESDIKKFTIFIQGDILFVEAPSYGKAEDFMALLRQALGSLAILPLTMAKDVPAELNRMVLEDLSAELVLGNKTALSMGEKEDKENWSGKGPTCNAEAKDFLEAGFDVVTLELNCDLMNFNIKQDMSITGIKFSSGIFDSFDNGDVAGTTLLILDEVSKMADKLIKEFGGLEQEVEV